MGDNGLDALASYGWLPLIIDLQGGTCAIPSGLFCRRVVHVSDIERVRLERKRREPGMYRNVESPQVWSTHAIDRDRIIVRLKEGQAEQRLWGRLGIPGDAEAVAREIAACLACKLERRPPGYFSPES